MIGCGCQAWLDIYVYFTKTNIDSYKNLKFYEKKKINILTASMS